MTKKEYVDDVTRVLSRWSEDTKKKIEFLAERIPANARKAEITIFLDQDGEGSLNISMALEGPDLYVLNKAIQEHAVVFETKHGQGGFSSGLPMMEPDGDDFSVNHVLADCAVRWLEGLWAKIDSASFKVPVWIVVHDDYGTLGPVELKK